MKKQLLFILLLILNINILIFANGSQEIIYYENDINERKDEVSLNLQKIENTYKITNGILNISVLPWSSETYLYGTYPELKSQRYYSNQIKQQNLTKVRWLDDCNNVEKNLTYLMIMKLDTSDINYKGETYTIDDKFFKYIFLDNDNADFLRVTSCSIHDDFELNNKNNELAIVFSFGDNTNYVDLESFFRETKSLKISINKYGLENQSIIFNYPFNSIFEDIPEAPKNILQQLRNELEVTFQDSSILSLRNQKLYSTIDKPIDPIKEGYIFNGWYKDKYFVEKWNFNFDKITNNTTLYAKWKPKIYTLKIKNTDNNFQNLSIKYNNKIKLSQIMPFQDYQLEGLYKDPNFLQKWNFEYDTVCKNQILYAKWDKSIRFVISNGAELASLDPALIQSIPEHRIYMAMFEGLVTSDPKTANAVPGLATSWESSEDGTQYTFHLRKTTWSDGTPITAHDVVYSWLRELNPITEAYYAWFPSMFIAGAADYNSGKASADAVGIRALDDYTFQMDLIGQMPYVVDALTHYSFAVVPQHAIEEFGKKWTDSDNIVSNGPFLLKEREPLSHMSFIPNESYWDRDAIQIDKLVFLSSDDENTNYNKFTNGEIDWIINVPTDKLASAQMKDSYQANAQLATYYYVFQMNKAPLDNLLVRKAISYAIDREELVEGVTRAGQIPAWGIVPPITEYSPLEFPFENQKQATEMAQEFLAAAGYPNGVGFPTLEILYNTSDGHKQIAEFVKQQLLTKLGIKVELINEEWGSFLSDRSSGNFKIARAGWVGDYQDPNTFLDMFMTGATMNSGQYSNDLYDTLLKEAEPVLNSVDRLGILKTAEDILINEDCSIMPFYYYISYNMIDTNIWGGWYPNTMDYHPLKTIFKKP